MAKLDYFGGFKTIFQYLKPHRREVFVLILLSIFSSLAAGFLPYIVSLIIDALIAPDKTVNVFDFILPTAVVFIIFWFFIRVTNDFVGWLLDFRNEKLSTTINAEYIVRGFNKLLTLPLSFHKTKKMGEVTNRISSASGWLYNILEAVIINLAPEFLSIIVALIIIFSVKPVFSVVFVFTITIYSLVLIKVTPKLVKLQTHMQRAYNRAYGDAFDSIGNVQAIKQATGEKFEYRKTYKNFISGAVNLYLQYSVFWQSLNRAQRILISLTHLSIFLMSYFFIKAGQLTIGNVIMFISYGSMIFNPFVTLGRNWQTIQNGLVAIQRSEKILTLEPEPYEGGETIENLKGDVDFVNVSFAYERKRKMLKNISFKVKAGEIIALVGESGVGKTTIIDLLSRFFKPQRGKILIDQIDINKINLVFLRQNIAVVPQEVVLFNDTIKNNIKYGQFDASEKEVREAARIAYADEFIESFPRKYSQLVGERGIKLSVGQKQRIAIARAVLRNPRILVLDEPTSALDAKSEQYVTEALEKLMKNRTTFIIAHRLSTVRKADKIIVLDRGQVVEVGKHDELIQKLEGVYRKLYELQFNLK